MPDIMPNIDLKGSEKTPEINIELLKRELGLFSNLLGRRIELVLDEKIDTAATDCKTKIRLNPHSAIVTDNDIARALLQHEQAHNFGGTNMEVAEKLKEDYAEQAKTVPGLPDVIENVYNILEDYRVEHIWQTLFRGSQRNFSKLYKNAMEHLKTQAKAEGVTDPVSALLIARFGLSGKSIELEPMIAPEMRETYKKLASELKKLESKDWTATYVIAKNVVNEVLKYVKEKEPGQQKSAVDKMNQVAKSAYVE